MLQKRIALAKWGLITSLFLGIGCKKENELPEKLPGEFIYISGGKFSMGSPSGTPYMNEQPQHMVTVDPFYMDSTELKITKFFEFLSSSDTNFIVDPLERKKNYYYETVGGPVAGVSFNNALLYCNWRSKKDRLVPCYTFNSNGTVSYNKSANGYRLPTEAEWEYACRAKSITTYSFAEDSSMAEIYAWYAPNSNTIKAVATKKPNAFGLYDMHGNVSEWVWDWYPDAAPYYPMTDQTNPVGGLGTTRVYRGGSYKNYAINLRSAKRFSGRPQNRYEDVGIRLARNI